MSDKKEPVIVVGAEAKKGRLLLPSVKTRKEKIFWIVAGVLVIGGVLFAIFRPRPAPIVDCSAHINRLSTETYQKNYEGVKGLADLFLKDNCSPKEKAEILELKAVVLLYQKKFDEAEQTFKQVEVVNNGKLDAGAAQALAELSVKNGDKAGAIKYYKELIQIVQDTPDTIDNSGIPSYKQAIKSLGGTP